MKILLFSPIYHKRKEEGITHIKKIYNQITKNLSNVKVDIFYITDDPYDNIFLNLAYKWNLVKEKVSRENYDYVLCIEEDVYPPKDILKKMLSAVKKYNYEIISGLYKFRDGEWKDEYMIFKNNVPIKEGIHFKKGDIIEVDRIPFGCLFLHREVVEKIMGNLDIGGDATFNNLAKLHNYTLYAHTGIICEHYKTSTVQKENKPPKIKKKELFNYSLTISVATYNFPKIEQLINDIIKHTKSKWQLIITDNNSDKKYQRTLKKIQHKYKKRANIIFKFNKSNKGYLSVHNKIAEKVKTDFLCIINDDIEIKEDGWDIKCIEKFLENENLAQVGIQGMCNYISKDGIGVIHNGEPEYIEGAFIFMPVRIVKDFIKINGSLFDKNLKFMYYEDSILSLKLRRQGYKIMSIPLEIYHKRIQREVKPELEDIIETAKAFNKLVFLKEFDYYLKTRQLYRKILFIRDEGYGDVLFLTPFIKALKQKNPYFNIFVKTKCGEILQNNPFIERIIKPEESIDYNDFDFIYDFNLAYELSPKRNILEAYNKVLPIEIEPKLEFYPSKNTNCVWNTSKIKLLLDDTPTWNIRSWKKFDELENLINKKKYDVVRVRSLPRNFDVIAHYILESDMFITCDKVYFHISQALNKQSISIWGGTNPEYRITNRKKTIIVKKNLTCSGCLHLHPPPVKYADCLLPNGKKYLCLNSITAEEVYEIIEKYFSKKKKRRRK